MLQFLNLFLLLFLVDFLISFAFLVTDSPDNQGKKNNPNFQTALKGWTKTTGSKTPSKCSCFKVWIKKVQTFYKAL